MFKISPTDYTGFRLKEQLSPDFFSLRLASASLYAHKLLYMEPKSSPPAKGRLAIHCNYTIHNVQNSFQEVEEENQERVKTSMG